MSCASITLTVRCLLGEAVLKTQNTQIARHDMAALSTQYPINLVGGSVPKVLISRKLH
jgi:hypothetical protein